VHAVVYSDTNGNGVRDAGEAVIPRVDIRLKLDGRFPDDSRPATTDDQGEVSWLDAFATPLQGRWVFCPSDADHWWVTGVTPDFGESNGCGSAGIVAGPNEFAIGLQDMSQQSAAGATLVADGFADHNRNGVQDTDDTPLPVDTRLFLTGPEPNANRSSYSDNNLVMHWGTVFAPAPGYAWKLCLDESPPNDADRFEITSVTPGGTAAGDGCWDVTIAPGENHWSIGFYDRVQPEGTPTPTMTPTATATPVTKALTMSLDCDPGQAGVQPACDVQPGTTDVDVDLELVNGLPDAISFATFDGWIKDGDASRLDAPEFPAAGVRGNPGVGEQLIDYGVSCAPPPRTHDSGAALASILCILTSP
jgi:hypothetical protein